MAAPSPRPTADSPPWSAPDSIGHAAWNRLLQPGVAAPGSASVLGAQATSIHDRHMSFVDSLSVAPLDQEGTAGVRRDDARVFRRAAARGVVIHRADRPVTAARAIAVGMASPAVASGQSTSVDAAHMPVATDADASPRATREDVPRAKYDDPPRALRAAAGDATPVAGAHAAATSALPNVDPGAATGAGATRGYEAAPLTASTTPLATPGVVGRSVAGIDVAAIASGGAAAPSERGAMSPAKLVHRVSISDRAPALPGRANAPSQPTPEASAGPTRVSASGSHPIQPAAEGHRAATPEAGEATASTSDPEATRPVARRVSPPLSSPQEATGAESLGAVQDAPVRALAGAVGVSDGGGAPLAALDAIGAADLPLARDEAAPLTASTAPLATPGVVGRSVAGIDVAAIASGGAAAPSERGAMSPAKLVHRVSISDRAPALPGRANAPSQPTPEASAGPTRVSASGSHPIQPAAEGHRAATPEAGEATASTSDPEATRPVARRVSPPLSSPQEATGAESLGAVQDAPVRALAGAVGASDGGGAPLAALDAIGAADLPLARVARAATPRDATAPTSAVAVATDPVGAVARALPMLSPARSALTSPPLAASVIARSLGWDAAGPSHRRFGPSPMDSRQPPIIVMRRAPAPPAFDRTALRRAEATSLGVAPSTGQAAFESAAGAATVFVPSAAASSASDLAGPMAMSASVPAAMSAATSIAPSTATPLLAVAAASMPADGTLDADALPLARAAAQRVPAAQVDRASREPALRTAAVSAASGDATAPGGTPVVAGAAHPAMLIRASVVEPARVGAVRFEAPSARFDRAPDLPIARASRAGGAPHAGPEPAGPESFLSPSVDPSAMTQPMLQHPRDRVPAAPDVERAAPDGSHGSGAPTSARDLPHAPLEMPVARMSSVAASGARGGRITNSAMPRHASANGMHGIVAKPITLIDLAGITAGRWASTAVPPDASPNSDAASVEDGGAANPLRSLPLARWQRPGDAYGAFGIAPAGAVRAAGSTSHDLALPLAAPALARDLQPAPLAIAREAFAASAPYELPAAAAMPGPTTLPSTPAQHAAAPPPSAGRAAEADVDDLVERAWQTLMSRLAIEQERRGFARWS